MQVDAEGASLNYEISGDSSKPALLLWHGAGCTLRMWDMALDSLKRYAGPTQPLRHYS